MAVHTGHLRFSTEGDGDVIDLTEGVHSVLEAAGVQSGVVSVFDRLVPREGDYAHNRLNNDTNSHAHIRAAIVGPSESVPVRDGRLELGTWQQLVLIDFDDRPRRRTVVVQVIG